MKRFKQWFAGTLATAVYLLSAFALSAQESLPAGRMAEQNLRPYWLVFTAYAIAIVLIMLWAGMIAKRLSGIEDRLAE